MATEEDRQEERDRLGTEPLQAPPAERLSEENPIESPATPGPDDDEAANKRAAETSEPPQLATRSTEGLTVGGDETGNEMSSAEQAVRRQEEMERSGEEAPA